MLSDQTLQLQEDLTDDQFVSQVLLSISNDIAATRTKDDLIEVLLERFKALVAFDDIHLMLYEKETHALYFWAHRFYTERLIHADFDLRIASEYPIDDGILNIIHAQKEPVVFDIEELYNSGNPVPDYVPYYNSTGVKELVGVVMRSNTTDVGGFFLTSTIKGNFKKEHLAIIKGISSQLCIAVSNVLANEIILKHQEEKSILLDLSNAISTAKAKKDLLNVVRATLEINPAFSEVIVSNYEPKTSKHYIYNNDTGSLIDNHTEPGGILLSDEIFSKQINETIIHNRKPGSFDIAEHINKGQATPYMEKIFRDGARELTGVAIRAGGMLLGCVYMATKNDPRFKKDDYGFLQGIADQLTIALVNINTSDEILEREKEKSVLLSISNAMAAIRNKSDLLVMVQERLKKLFYFSHAVTAVTDLESQTYKSLVVDPGSRSRNHPEFHRIAYAEYPLNTPLIKTVIASKEPVIFNLDELDFSKDIPEWILMNYRSGIKEMVMSPLFNGKDLIGIVIVFSDRRHLLQEKELRLIQGISWQLSVAVGNILANEHVLEQDNEKSTLIDLSKNFAVIRNKDELHQIINLKLKKLLSISHVITFSISDDGKWYTAYSLDPNSAAKAHKDYETITTSRYAVKDGILDVVLESETPLVYDLDEVLKQPFVPKYLRMNYDVGMRGAVLAPLKDGDKKNGILVILMKEKSKLNKNYIRLIQGVSDQLSIAVANIKANERIEQQLMEINQFKKQLEEENLYLQEEIQTTNNYSELIGNSAPMKKIFELVSKVAESESSVLILGETGTGKELIARAIHSTSLRKDKVMIKVNCATLPANLIESELFGHERGSFTGATEKRIGKFELANNSTLFLDEVGELPLDLQVKLLRVLQEKEIERVGGRTTIKTNVRIIAATNRDLHKEVQMGSFRSDLFFRLNVFPINIPALRERKEDIPLLASHFLAKHAKKSMKSNMTLSGKVIRELTSYEWPGNVRELEHLIERSVLLSNGRIIEQVYLPGAVSEDESLLPGSHVKTIDEVEREHIISILKRCNGKVSGAGGAAELLKIPATTLSSKMLRLKIGKGLASETNNYNYKG